LKAVSTHSLGAAVAVTAVAKFGVAKGADASGKSSLKVLLTRRLDDPEDEVRDRSALDLKLLENEQAALKFQNGIPLHSILCLWC